MLDSVTFASGNDPTNSGANTTRTISWQVNDGAAANNLSTPVQMALNIIVQELFRPVVTAISAKFTVSHQTPVSATSLFTATDPDGDAVVQYDFWDSGSAGDMRLSTRRQWLIEREQSFGDGS